MQTVLRIDVLWQNFPSGRAAVLPGGLLLLLKASINLSDCGGAVYVLCVLLQLLITLLNKEQNNTFAIVHRFWGCLNLSHVVVKALTLLSCWFCFEF